jgi:hypothetical protein
LNIQSGGQLGSTSGIEIAGGTVAVNPGGQITVTSADERADVARSRRDDDRKHRSLQEAREHN